MGNEETMNRFVHRILKSSTASSIAVAGVGKSTQQHHAPAVQQLVKELQHAKLVYFGEFHGESRITEFQTELVKEWAKCLASSSASGPNTDPPRLHLIMEHFSVDMQSLLEKYQRRDGSSGDEFPDNEDEAFEKLISSYKEFGTEGHDLQPYRKLLQFCRQTTPKDAPTNKCPRNDQDQEAQCKVHIHGGFIPRNHAARLNKECPDKDSKRAFFEEMSSQRGYLPKEGDAMHNALFEEDSSSYTLRGSREHRLLIQSLMSGTDLYSPPESGEEDLSENENEPADEESPMSRLYQAQVLKDHAMGYKIASLMLDNHTEAKKTERRPLSSDRYIVIAGFGHLKHHLGVPDRVNGYLRQEALAHPDKHRRAAAMDLLLSTSRPPLSVESTIDQSKFGGNGSALIGCQMMYEAYLEDSYPPMIEAANVASDDDEEDDGDDGDDAAEQTKRKLLKDLYLQHPERLDEYILKSQEINGPFLNFAKGIAGFEHPCADYLYVYDEDDENNIEQADLDRIYNESKCPFHQQQTDSGNKGAKAETVEAYEQVGKTAGMKGNAARARAIMSQIGYSEEDMAYIGDSDIYNFQGVANPHRVAKVQQGEAVLDIGSGLGVDSFLAMRDCGADKHHRASVDTASAPFVVGVDLAESEVKHASKRASERGYVVPGSIQFIRADVEKLDAAFSSNNLPMGKFDVCISNGAFCLVPDKSKAFGNVFKALCPGGRMAISTTTIVSDSLDPTFEWPVCMRMFASLESLKPMCEGLGFKNVRIIDAESPMEGMEIPAEDEDQNDGGDSSQRFKIHGKYADQFTFLENMDMDELCKVVTVYGEKP